MRKGKRLPRDGRDLARETEVRQQVGAVGADVDHQLRVADGHGAQKRRARRNVDIELQDAVRLFAEAKDAAGRLER